VLVILVAFAAGSMMGVAFLELIPESFGAIGNFHYVLFGILGFLLLESLIHWHHTHYEKNCCDKCTSEQIKPAAYLNLIGDALHNFIDGLIVSAGFLASTASGISITLAMALHEIPQEIGDFGILMKSGFSRKKALFSNFLSALFAVVGAIAGYFFLNHLQNLTPYVIAIAAGGFIYIAGSDLIPELHEKDSYQNVLLKIIFLILGVALMWFL
jgi:zinc and cadmium transporter